MRTSRAEKERSRERIIAAASRLFRARGVDATGVSDVMRTAGLTQGGFYRHFPDKERLLAAGLEAAFEEFAQQLEACSEDHAEAVREGFFERYLSLEHRDNPAVGCPAAALGADVARQGGLVRAAFSRGLERVLRGLARGRPSAPDPRGAALRALATAAGAVMLARALDDDLAREVLAACRPVDVRAAPASERQDRSTSAAPKRRAATRRRLPPQRSQS
jgi:TetR/AcrR family transcriptional regulator, transcriptional repressor for nem operon